MTRKTDWILVVSIVAICSFDCRQSTPPDDNMPTDSTSHNFTWQTFTFGNAGGSQLYDVAIINDTLAYAVGAIYLNDSLGNSDPNSYNLTRWDGVKWGPMRLQFHTFCGQPDTGSYPAQAIWAFAPTDMWITSGSEITHFDGTNQLSTGCIPVSTSKLWGTSSSDLYAVGAIGNIAHYNGSSWTKLQSGTTLPINDIWGAYNGYAGQWEILAVASDDVNRRVLRIQGTTVSSVPDGGLSNSLYGVWFVPNEKYYIVGAGIGSKNALDSSPWSVYPSGVVTSYASGGVRGNDINDVFVTGSFFEIVHYNGSSWHNYRDVIPFTDGAVGRIAIKGNLMITVGLSGQNAVAIVGKR